MIEFVYRVYVGDDAEAVCFGAERDAMEYARDEAKRVGEGKSVRVEKAEIRSDDDTGEEVGVEQLIELRGEGEAQEDYEDDNPFDVGFPRSDIEYAEEPADVDDVSRFPSKDGEAIVKEAVRNLEEHENEVECKCCFELFPKDSCVKTEDGWLCRKCDQESRSHQGTNLDLIDADPFDLDYDDPRDPDEEDEPEVEEEPIDGTEIRKHEAGIKEKLNEAMGDVADYKYKAWLEMRGTDNAFYVMSKADDEKAARAEIAANWPDCDIDWIVEITPDEKAKGKLEALKEHVNEERPAIESEQKLQGTDNAVVDCPVAKVIAHSEDEKPLDCKMDKPALDKPLAGDKVDIKINEDLTEAEIRELDEELAHLNEELKLFTDIGDYKPWSGAVDTYNKINDAGKLNELEAYIEELFPDGLSMTELNDILWFDADRVLDALGLEHEPYDESLNEAKKDEEKLPPDPGAVKVEVHQELNNLVNDEIEAINGYEEAKADILDKPIEHKDEIVATINHIKEEEKEHIDELIDAASEIPFDGEREEAETEIAEEPAVEEPITEPEPEVVPEEPTVEESVNEDPFNQEFPKNEEKPLAEAAARIPFDSDVTVGDKIKIIHLAGEDDSYNGKEGEVDRIDGIGQLHGTWGGLAVIPGVDEFEVITEEPKAEESLKEHWWEDDDPMNWDDHAPLTFACYYDRQLLGYLEYPYMGREVHPTTIKDDIAKQFGLPADYSPEKISWIEDSLYSSHDETKPTIKIEERANEHSKDLLEASSAEKKAFKNGGKDLDDLLIGKAVAALKNKSVRKAVGNALHDGDPEKVAELRKLLLNDPKIGDAEAKYVKKAGAMERAGLVAEAKDRTVDDVVVYAPYKANKDGDFWLYTVEDGLDANDRFCQDYGKAHKFASVAEAKKFCEDHGIEDFELLKIMHKNASITECADTVVESDGKSLKEEAEDLDKFTPEEQKRFRQIVKADLTW